MRLVEEEEPSINEIQTFDSSSKNRYENIPLLIRKTNNNFRQDLSYPQISKITILYS